MSVTLNYAATYDPTTNIGLVRMTVQDIDVDTEPPDGGTPRNQWSCLFVDQEIAIKIAKYSALTNALDMAAAELLDDIASSNALLAKLITLGDYTSDTRQTANTLRAQATYLRGRAAAVAAAGADEPAEAITDEAWTDANWQRELWVPGDIPG